MGKKRWTPTAFYDLNIQIDGLPPLAQRTVIATALQLGYSGVALNHVIKGSLSSADVCTNRTVKLSEVATVGTEIAQSAQFHRDVLGVPAKSRAFKQYERLTIVIDNVMQAASLNSANPILRSYDLIAISPEDQRVFEQACTHLEVDIISLDYRSSIRLKPPCVKSAIERGIVFEIVVNGAFQDISERRQLVAQAQKLQAVSRGKNIIITSGAQKWMHLRGPNDIANLGSLFALSRENAKASVSKNCENVIQRGLKRKKTFKSAFIVDAFPTFGKNSVNDDTWFDIPKVWDPLLNANAEELYVLPDVQNRPVRVDEKEFVGACTVQNLETVVTFSSDMHEDTEQEASEFLSIDPNGTAAYHQKKRRQLTKEKSNEKKSRKRK